MVCLLNLAFDPLQSGLGFAIIMFLAIGFLILGVDIRIVIAVIIKLSFGFFLRLGIDKFPGLLFRPKLWSLHILLWLPNEKRPVCNTIYSNGMVICIIKQFCTDMDKVYVHLLNYVLWLLGDGKPWNDQNMEIAWTLQHARRKSWFLGKRFGSYPCKSNNRDIQIATQFSHHLEYSEISYGMDLTCLVYTLLSLLLFWDKISLPCLEGSKVQKKNYAAFLINIRSPLNIIIQKHTTWLKTIHYFWVSIKS